MKMTKLVDTRLFKQILKAKPRYWEKIEVRVVIDRKNEAIHYANNLRTNFHIAVINIEDFYLHS
jgi:hypothetical protein